MFARVLMIHCATGHQYLAIDTDEIIHDPFTEEEEINAAKDEHWKIMNEEG